MSDRIEIMLSSALQDVTRHLTEARRNVVVLELDANRIEKLYAIHLQMKEDEDPPTQAFPAVPPAGVDNEDDPKIWTDAEGIVWPLQATYADPHGYLWHWAGGFESVDDGPMQPLMSRNDWVIQDSPLFRCPPLAVYQVPPPAAPADPAVTLTDLDATPKDGADHAER